MKLKDILYVQTMWNDFFYCVLNEMYGNSLPAIVVVGHKLCSVFVSAFYIYCGLVYMQLNDEGYISFVLFREMVTVIYGV